MELIRDVILMSNQDANASHKFLILISLFKKHQLKSYQEKHPQIPVLLIIPFPNSSICQMYLRVIEDRENVTDVAIKTGRENLYIIYTLELYKEEKIC